MMSISFSFHTASCVYEEVHLVCLTIENDVIGACGWLSAGVLDYILHGVAYVIF